MTQASAGQNKMKALAIKRFMIHFQSIILQFHDIVILSCHALYEFSLNSFALFMINEF